jgi:uncharacterized protein YutD
MTEKVLNKSKKNQTERSKDLDAVIEEVIATEEPAKEEKYKGEKVTIVDEVNLLVGDRKYRLVHNHRDGFDAEKLGERFSDVLSRYDYVVGDWGYEQLRLKGFFNASHKKALPEQRIDTIEDYLYEYCNFGCAFFVIERVGGKHDLRDTEVEKPRKKRKRKKKPTQQAYTEEKRGAVPPNKPVKKQKPVIKNRKKNVETTTSTTVKKEKNEKRSFTIRQK